MGYSYCDNKLCCDSCGNPGARKRRCPAGYCPAPALCGECNARVRGDGTWKDMHKGCAARHAEYAAQKAREAEILASGAFIRSSALGYFDGTGRVRVIFRDRERREIAYDMHEDAYHALPYGETFTPEDYAKHGAITPALATFADMGATP